MIVSTVCQRAGCVPLECQRAVFLCDLCVGALCMCLLCQRAVCVSFVAVGCDLCICNYTLFFLCISLAVLSAICVAICHCHSCSHLPVQPVCHLRHCHSCCGSCLCDCALICLCNLSAICVTVTLAVACLCDCALICLCNLSAICVTVTLAVAPAFATALSFACAICACLSNCALICLCNLCLPFHRGPCHFVCCVCHLSGRCVPCVISLSLSCKHFGEHRFNGENVGGNKQNLFLQKIFLLLENPLILSPKAQITKCHQSQSQRPQSTNKSHNPNHQPQTHHES